MFHKLRKTMQSRNHVLFSFYSVKITRFAFFYYSKLDFLNCNSSSCQILIWKNTTSQILNWRISNASNLEILNWILYNTSDCDWKVSQRPVFEENFAFKKSPPDCFYSKEVTDFLCCFEEHNLKFKDNNLSDFE